MSSCETLATNALLITSRRRSASISSMRREFAERREESASSSLSDSSFTDVDEAVDGDVVVDVSASSVETDNNTLAHALRPSDTTIIKAFDAQDYGLEFGELKRFKELNDSLGWKKPLEVAVERWIANAKKEKPSKPASKPKNKFTDIEQHAYNHDAIEMALLQKQMDLPPMEGRSDA